MPLFLAFNQKTYTCKARKVWGLWKRLNVTATKKSRNWVIHSWQNSTWLSSQVRYSVDDLASKKYSSSPIFSFYWFMSTTETSSFGGKKHRESCLIKTQCLQCSRARGSFVVQSSLCCSARTRRSTFRFDHCVRWQLEARFDGFDGSRLRLSGE